MLIKEDEWRYYLAQNINIRMKSMKINRNDLINKTDISKTSLRRYLMGLNTPSVYDMVSIAEALDCNIDDLTNPIPSYSEVWDEKYNNDIE